MLIEETNEYVKDFEGETKLEVLWDFLNELIKGFIIYIGILAIIILAFAFQV